MDKQKVIYPNNGTLFDNKKKWNTYDVEEPQQHSMRKKPDIRGHKMYGSI